MEEGRRGVTTNENRALLRGGHGKYSKIGVVMVVQLHEYPKAHWIASSLQVVELCGIWIISQQAITLQMEIRWMQIYGNSYSYLIQFLEINALYTQIGEI